MATRCLFRHGVTLALTMFLGGPLLGQWYELSGDPGVVHQDNFGFVLESSDGEFVLYTAQDGTGPRQIFRVAADGRSDPVALTPAVPWASLNSTQLSPDDQWLVYAADHEVDERRDLYSVPADGSGPPVRLSLALHPDADVGNVKVLGDSSRAVYMHDQDTDGVLELFSVLLDGSQAPMRLNAPLAPNQFLAFLFTLSESTGRVLYRVDHPSQPSSLYSVPLDGSQTAVLLSGALDVGSYPRVSPDGQIAVFAVDVGVAEELYSARVDGTGTPTWFDFQPRWEGFSVSFTPDSVTAIISAEAPSGLERIFTGPADASSKPKNLSLSIDVRAGTERISPDGQLVAFIDDASTWNAHVAPTDGSAAPTQLTSFTWNFGVYNPVAWTADSQRIAFIAEDPTPMTIRHDVWSVLASGIQEPDRLSDPTHDAWGFDVSPAGDRVAYTENSREFTVWSAPIDGTADPFMMNGPMPSSGRVFVEAFSADGQRVYYHGDQTTKGVEEYYAAYCRPLDGIGYDIEPETPALGDSVNMLMTGGVPGGRCLWYLAGVDGLPLFLKLATTPIDGSGNANLSGPVPNDPSLSGVELQFFAFSLNGSGNVVQSNRQEILVQ